MSSSIEDLKLRAFQAEGYAGSVRDMEKQFYEALVLTPQVPAFSVHQVGTLTNVTGNTTDFPVTFNTELYDTASEVSAGVHTASKTGKYRYSAMLQLGQLGAATKIQITLSTTGGDYRIMLEAPNPLSGLQTAVPASITVPMTVGDTAQLKLRVDGLGGDTVDIDGVASPINASFQGEFVAN